MVATSNYKTEYVEMETQLLKQIEEEYRAFSDVVSDGDFVSVTRVGDLIFVVADNADYWEGEVLEIFGIIRDLLHKQNLRCEFISFGRDFNRTRIYVIAQVMQ
jgi:hypothetical protein